MSPFPLEIGLAVVGVLLLAIDALFPSLQRRLVPLLAIGSTALAALLFFTTVDPGAVVADFLKPHYGIDALALFYKGLALVTTLVVLIMALESESVIAHFTGIQGASTRIAEFFVIPLIVCSGLMWMASAKDLITMFVALELVTVSFYVLVAFTRRSALSLEAGVKYLILGALSTGILVYGIAWVYGATGSFTFEGIAQATAKPETSSLALALGAALLLAGLGFKVGAAPFHIWVPDVYQGAPTPVTAFLSVGSKAGGFIVLTRAVTAFTAEGSPISNGVSSVLLGIGAITVLLGGLAAIPQKQMKRLLAYSSISHAGFLIMALACGESVRFGLSSGGIVAFYLATYLPMTLLAFLLIAVLRSQGTAEDLASLTGLAKRSPSMAFAMTLALASLAGLPLTAGFFGKMLVFMAAVDRGYYSAVALAVVGAAAGFYYYFKPILAIYSAPKQDAAPLQWSALARSTAYVLMALIVILGVYPKVIQSVLQPVARVSAAVK